MVTENLMKFFIFKFYWISRLFLIFVLLNFSELSFADQFNSLIAEYNHFSKDGNLKKSTIIFKELIKKYPDQVPEHILLKHGHILVDQNDWEAHDIVHSIIYKRIDRAPNQNRIVILKEILHSMAVSRQRFVKAKDTEYDWSEYYKKNLTSYPQNYYALHLKNINDLKVIEYFHSIGDYNMMDSTLMRLIVLNALAKGNQSEEMKSILLNRAMIFFQVTGREKLSYIIKNKLEKLYGNTYALEINSTNLGGDIVNKFNFFMINGEIKKAKNILYKYFERKNNNYNTMISVDYELLYAAVLASMYINDENFIKFVKKELKEIKMLKYFDGTLDLSIYYSKIISNKKSKRISINDLTMKAKKATEDLKLLNKMTQLHATDNSTTMHNSMANITALQIAFELFIEEGNYKLGLYCLEEIEKIWQFNYYSQKGFAMEGVKTTQIAHIKERLYSNLFKVKDKKYKSKMEKITLQIISKLDKSSSEITLNFHMTARKNGHKLESLVKEYEQLLKNREFFITNQINNFIDHDKSYKVNHIDDFEKNNNIFGSKENEIFRNFIKNEKFFYLTIKKIKKIDPKFFEKSYSHIFELDKLQKLLANNQSYYYYDFSKNYIFNCKISRKLFDCKSRKIDKKILDENIKIFRNSVINKDIPNNSLKKEIMETLFPHYDPTTIDDTIFLTLNPKHMGLPINSLFSYNYSYNPSQNKVSNLVLVPTLASSTFEFINTDKTYEGEYFGIGGAKYNKSKSIKNLDTMFSVRSGFNVSKVSELNYLPETLNEIKNVYKKFLKDNSKILLGENATEKNLRKESFGLYKYLHIATHGLISGELDGIDDSGLALTPGAVFKRDEKKYFLPSDDGLLQASEIAKMNVISDTVILSACQTVSDFGKSNSNGINGLALSFLKSGSGKIIVSQWNVDDKSSKNIFINSFVKHNNKNSFDLKNGIDIVKKINNKPYYWAPFIQVSIPANYNRKNKPRDLFFEKLKTSFDKFYIRMYGNIHENISKINLVVPNKETLEYDTYQFSSDLRDKKINLNKIDKIKFPYIIKNNTNNIFATHVNFKFDKKYKKNTNEIHLYDEFKNILIDKIKIEADYRWSIRDSLVYKNTLHLLYVGVDQSKRHRFFYIAYNLKTKKHKKYYLDNVIEFDHKRYRALDLQTIRLILLKNNIFISVTNNSYTDSDYIKFMPEIRNWYTCSSYRDSDTDIYIPENNQLKFHKKLSNIQIFSSENNSTANSNLLVRKVSSKDCSSKFYLTDLNMTNKIFISDGYNIKNATLSIINNKSYILLNRAVLVDGIDDVVSNNATIYHQDFFRFNFEDSSSGDLNHTLFWTNQVFRVSINSFRENPMQIKSIADYKVDLISNSQGNYDSNQYSFLLSNNKIYTVGNKNGKFAIQYLDKF